MGSTCENHAVTRRPGAMHIETARSHQTLKDGTERVYQRHLLRRSYRQGGKVRKQTLANLSHLPDEAIAALRLVLGGKTVVDADAALQVERSAGHGHVAAVHTIARQLGLPALLGPAGRERDLAYALLVSRVVRPRSKLSTIGWWDDVTLGADLGVAGASTDEVYQAMDWLVDRQDHIEAELARRHLAAGGIAMFDLSSSWMEGSHCELACFGYSRDGKRGKPQIEYGLLCDPAGRPVAVRVFAGNTADPTAFTQAVEVVRGSFDLRRLILVGDRGMITSARIGDLRATPAWPGSPRCAPPRSSSWPKTAARCSLACSTSRTWPRSPARTTPASGWWPAVTRCWPQSVPASEPTCWPPPRPCWPRSSSRWMPGGSRTPTRSVSRPTGHCASRRSPSTLWSRSPRGRSAGTATRPRSTPKLPWTASTSSAPPSRRQPWTRPARWPPTRTWRWSNATSATSRPTTWTCGPSGTGWPTGSAATCCCACWPATWSGTCEALGRR